jgi:hypothetical protein
MFDSITFHNIFVCLLLPVTAAAHYSSAGGCNESVAWGASPGASFTVHIPTSSGCDMAALDFQGQRPTEIQIASSCDDQNTTSQSFHVQLSNTSPLGDARLLFICDELTQPYCVPFRVEEPIYTEGYTSNLVQSVCMPPQSNMTSPHSTSPATRSSAPTQTVASSYFSATMPSDSGQSLSSLANSGQQSAGPTPASATPLSATPSSGLSSANYPLSAQSSLGLQSVADTTFLAQSSGLARSLDSTMQVQISTTISTATSLFGPVFSSSSQAGNCTCGG